ncbi:ComF family protein [Lacinutrix sp. Hel_I_90]|uniref:ComF family protein n=1 Tax=Lacinutrix sp. Hel_I_90 TaxID=1249999 RepID=UPI00350FAAA5
MSKLFYGRAKIINGTALLRFEKKGSVQQLIHELKYREQQDVGLFLGNWLGEELKTIEAYKSIDLVIPVPLHKNKLRRRGYNQVTKFGQQIAKALNTDYDESVLIKITNTTSQVNKKRFARWSNNDELFSLINKEKIENKHILLVDDIITTGATIEACIQVLNRADHVTISIATMAIA